MKEDDIPSASVNHNMPLAQRVKMYFNLLISPIVLLIVIPYSLVLGLIAVLIFARNEDENISIIEDKHKSKEGEYGFWYNSVRAQSEFRDNNKTVHYRLNVHALRALVAELEEVFLHKVDRPPQTATNRFFTGKEVRLGDEGYHAHLDIFGDETCELTVGTIDKEFFWMREPAHIYANIERWRKFVVLLKELDKTGPGNGIVLNSEQREWCLPDCSGQLVLELVD